MYLVQVRLGSQSAHIPRSLDSHFRSAGASAGLEHVTIHSLPGDNVAVALFLKALTEADAERIARETCAELLTAPELAGLHLIDCHVFHPARG